MTAFTNIQKPILVLLLSVSMGLVGCGQPIGNWQERKPVGTGEANPGGSKTGQNDQEQKNDKTEDEGTGSNGSASSGPFGCKSVLQDNLVVLNITWLIGPELKKENLFEFSFTAVANGATVTEYKPNVYLWMPAHGHGSAPVRLAETNGSKGLWRASNVHFIMPGLWELRVQLKKDGKVCDEYRQRIDL